MGKSDWIGAAIGLFVGGLGYLIGGPGTAVAAISLSAVILIVIHLRGREGTPEPGIGRVLRAPPVQSTAPNPSLPFVFGVPLGENDSPEWVMMIKHYGPETTFNCDIQFYDDDRKSIEHEWLTQHPNSSFLPPNGVAGKSQARFTFSEMNPEEMHRSFRWFPINPNSQHYTVSISCRDGYFVEKWEVTRVNGVLLTRIRIEHGPQWVAKNPRKDPTVFSCTDQGFLATALATVAPTTRPQAVNPGWKPNHTFVFPVAIIDPNGNLQVMSAVKLPDGSQKTDFGCWNMLVRHFGDA